MVQSVLAAVNYGVELQRIQQSDYCEAQARVRQGKAR